MRLLALSDWRAQDTALVFDIIEGLDKPVDLIAYAGDDLNRFIDDDRNIFSELASETRLRKILAVYGNDEIPLSVLEFDDSVPDGVMEGNGVHDLHEEPYIHGDYIFLGQEGAIEGGPGFNLYSEEEIANHLREQYSGHEGKFPIVLSHVPPHGILDIGRRFGQRHVGSKSLRSFIEEEEPLVTICGHCHQFGGRSVEDDFGVVINVASHDSQGAEGRYAIVELDGSHIEYELTTTEEGADNRLYQLSQVGVRRVHHFLDAGISELEDLIYVNRETLLELPGIYDWHVDMWRKEIQAIMGGEFQVLDEEEFDFLNREDTILIEALFR